MHSHAKSRIAVRCNVGGHDAVGEPGFYAGWLRRRDVHSHDSCTCIEYDWVMRMMYLASARGCSLRMKVPHESALDRVRAILHEVALSSGTGMPMTDNGNSFR